MPLAFPLILATDLKLTLLLRLELGCKRGILTKGSLQVLTPRNAFTNTRNC